MIGGNAIEPRGEGGVAPKRVERLIRFEEDLLRGVFGGGGVVQQRCAQAQDAFLVFPHEVGIVVPLTSANSLDDLEIFDHIPRTIPCVPHPKRVCCFRRFQGTKCVALYLLEHTLRDAEMDDGALSRGS